ncbi:unnamed protein product (macronuclear) [Paramecium tetraurelia]|uniref:Transmembrane protein n=1 Tax=Paramecium tetraurelia TaxID=5888 RepID=A0BSW7_PARTE|nr:uncharacterized protein GSPATT00031866001 [Paramecium tetraurelia]CAK61634.1 unnamed protein product [Paramecium tetraurelia]|eukprot:XP_001429032.1 hypothetical protein (macronuclear) [Paramecium tetraurelia strain d4-2]
MNHQATKQDFYELEVQITYQIKHFAYCYILISENLNISIYQFKHVNSFYRLDYCERQIKVSQFDLILKQKYKCEVKLSEDSHYYAFEIRVFNSVQHKNQNYYLQKDTV